MKSKCVVILSKKADMLYCNEEKSLFFPQYENGLKGPVTKTEGETRNCLSLKKILCKDGFFFSSKLAHCFDSVRLSHRFYPQHGICI